MGDISVLDELLQPLKETVIGDKGYVSMKTHEKLKARDIFVVAKARKNMKRQNRALAEVGVVQLETNSSRLRRKAFFYEKAA